MNLTAIRIRFVTRLLALPWVWIPLAVAAVLILSGYDNQIAIACIWLAPISLIGTILLYSPEILRQSVQDVRHAVENSHLGELRSLRRRLREDADHRSSQLVRDLRRAFDRMRQNDLDLATPQDSQAIAELKSQAQTLYHSCHQSLERTYKLWKTAQQIRSTERSTELMETRSGLLGEVGDSLQNLEHAVDFLQSNRLQAEDNSQVSEAREELEHGLDLARQVQNRLNQLDQELNLGVK